MTARARRSSPRICLNMIVRNESAILERCLQSTAPHVDYFVLCDTGSHDGTADVGRKIFERAGVSGEVHSIDFHNFEQARNQALELCRAAPSAFDYILLLDADMELVVEDPRWRHGLSHPAYLMRQVSSNMSYFNLRIVQRNTRARYVGMTHEYLDVGAETKVLEGAHLRDHACGSSRSDKIKRDIALLEFALRKDPNDGRSLFYLAQTYREAGRYADAIQLYQRRIELGGWDEETWYCKYMIARCHEGLGDIPRFISACLEAYSERPSRAEPLHALALHYRNVGQHDACAAICEMGEKIPFPSDLLFVEEPAYRAGFRQEFSISGYYSRDADRRARAREVCRELTTDRAAPEIVRETARNNWRFYARSSADLFGVRQYHSVDIALPTGYNPCNPSLAMHDGQLWCALRTVNYKLEDGYYVIADEDEIVRTQSYLLPLDGDLRPMRINPIVEADKSPFPEAKIQGLEDIRIVSWRSRMFGSCTVADRHESGRRQLAILELELNGTVRWMQLQDHESEHHQKNWMPFVYDGELCFVYWTDPTIILRFDLKRRQCYEWRRHIPPLALENQRGGSPLIPFDDGWLFVAHEVSHDTGRRTYLHRFILLDEGLRLKAVTEPFYFRTPSVEFCSGLLAWPTADKLLVSFGSLDSEAYLGVFEAAAVRQSLRRVKRMPRPRR